MARKDREPIEVSIDDLAFGGEGVGRHEGQVTFVAGAFPGERVRVLPDSGRKRWQRAHLLEILVPSADRVPPRCSHTGICGGCVYQTLAYPAQLVSKAHQVRENLARIAGITVPEPEPPIPAPQTFHYRNKMEFTFASRAWDPRGAPAPGAEAGELALGLHVPGRFDAIFDVEDCALADPEVNALLATVRGFAREHQIPAYHGRRQDGILRHMVVRASHATGEWLVALVVREEHVLLRELAETCRRLHPRIAGFLLWIHPGVASVARADTVRLLFGKERIVERLLDLEFELSASSFFQTNTAAAEGLLAHLREVVPPVELMLDLYCGVGTIGLGLSGRCNRLIGVESLQGAVEDAERNARRNGIANARFLTARIEDWARPGGIEPPDLVVVDPPRVGLHPRAIEGILALGPGRIVYVSCNPATLARDLQALVAAGYRAGEMRILDLFPHTPHVETVVLLER
jgi:23S rRNA (uracil1939-C5)-methyltransferase